MAILQRMKAAYARVEEYQTETVVSEYRKGRLVQSRQFLYRFKKPDHVRIEMESPHPGMTLVYPDERGEVAVTPGGWAEFLRFHLSLQSSFLSNRAGQRIDQTDFGQLIRNMAHSLTDQRRGEVKVSEEKHRVVLEVLAEDHFLPGVLTLYHFVVDRKSWLPAEVIERTPEGVLKRKVIFRQLRILTATSKDQGGEPGHGHPSR